MRFTYLDVWFNWLVAPFVFGPVKDSPTKGLTTLFRANTYSLSGNQFFVDVNVIVCFNLKRNIVFLKVFLQVPVGIPIAVVVGNIVSVNVTPVFLPPTPNPILSLTLLLPRFLITAIFVPVY
jgi:hypothetical protein